MKKFFLLGIIAVFSCVSANLASAQTTEQLNDVFRQLSDEVLPTPNVYRTASGAPGHKYWQQQADYKIDVTLDDDKQRIIGSAEVKYYNNSPDTLRYLWIQLDQNRFAHNSGQDKSAFSSADAKAGYGAIRAEVYKETYEGGYKISRVTDSGGAPLPHVINDTMMRIDLPTPLRPGQKISFNIDWSYNVLDATIIGARGGKEFFKEDGNYIYEIAQWFPRMAAYSDYDGWTNKQFLGNGEFTLEFGDYEVAITVPADHVVSATGVLQNPRDVLSSVERERLEKAKTSKTPVMIVTTEDAAAKLEKRATTTKTWRFKANNVRDFAFASSRKFLWDAQGFYQKENDKTVMAMSFYPEEGNPIWSAYSTQAIIHTLEVYNRYSLVYPYPVAISVNGPVGGMEYPMICFNGPRPTLDKKTGKKTYSRRTKYGLISVIIHEVGHNYFPMIVNSDERQWTWMDEGLNTFLQNLAEEEWEKDYPTRRAEPYQIVNYMKSTKQVPIMTNSESILQFGNNAYAKPAIALRILRETVMGRELFDFAFREYSRRWKFKRPTPSDFFRTMEDASGVDLDWFWRGWFYTTQHVDISLDKVERFNIDTKDPEIEEAIKRAKDQEKGLTPARRADQELEKRTDRFPELLDFYNEHDEFTVTNKQRNDYTSLIKGLEDWQKALLSNKSNIYKLHFSNIGGLVMPLPLEVTYEDGSKEEIRINAEIWRKNAKKVTRALITDKVIASVSVDPYWEIADTNMENNHYPRRIEKSRFELIKRKKSRDMMKEFETKLKSEDDDKKEKEDSPEK
ncbi:M1 family metallopeptidase [Paremcibacter congregatus]|uniref:M1 family metallopeptidase n=1 Tax=Paremcibacter congregatus TaxID=2043170 RepID=UPI0030EE1187|tara:strand:- start:1 stop:2376 length:2376 start_codon:yes stop_codon:yes gene_type:complete